MCSRACVLIYNGEYIPWVSSVSLPLVGLGSIKPIIGNEQDRGKSIETNQLAGSGPNVNQTITSRTNTRYSECPVAGNVSFVLGPSIDFGEGDRIGAFDCPAKKLKLFFSYLEKLNERLVMHNRENDGLFTPLFFSSFSKRFAWFWSNIRVSRNLLSLTKIFESSLYDVFAVIKSIKRLIKIYPNPITQIIYCISRKTKVC